jgi:hypothetical protein
MLYPEEDIEKLKTELLSEIRQFEESGYTYIYIRGLKMPPGCTPSQTDALLCPQSREGYTSRLFFMEIIQSPKSLNWNGQEFILGQQWHAFSYNNIQNMPLLDMVMNHLRGLVA